MAEIVSNSGDIPNGSSPSVESLNNEKLKPNTVGDLGKAASDAIGFEPGDSHENTLPQTVDALGPDAETSQQVDVFRHKSEELAVYAPEASARIDVYKRSMDLVSKHFGKETAAYVGENIAKIEERETHTLGFLTAKGEVIPREFKAAAAVVSSRNINPENLTLKEVVKIKEFLNDEETRLKQLENMLTLTVNAVHSRRDGRDPGRYDENYAEQLEYMQAKLGAYHAGEFDTSRGFDVETALARHDTKNSDYNWEEDYGDDIGDDVRYSIIEGLDNSSQAEDDYYGEDYTRRRDMESLINDESLDVDELVALGAIKEDDILVCGPLTEAEERFILNHARTHFVTAQNWRFNDSKYIDPETGKTVYTRGEVGKLLNDTIGVTTVGNDEMFIYDFVAKEIIQERTLDAKSSLLVAAASGMESQEYLETLQAQAKGKGKDSIEARRYDSFRKNLEQVSAYCRKILGIDKEQIEKEFGGQMPKSEEYFQFIARKAAELSDEEVQELTEQQSAYLVKMDKDLNRIREELAADEAIKSGNGLDELFSEEDD